MNEEYEKLSLNFNGCMYCKKGILRFLWLNYEELREHINKKHNKRLKEFDKNIKDYLKEKNSENNNGI